MTSQIASVTQSAAISDIPTTSEIPGQVESLNTALIDESDKNQPIDKRVIEKAPANMDGTPNQKMMRQFQFMGKKMPDWFSFQQQCTGSTSEVAKMLHNLQVSSGTLSHPKQQQYSIFEAECAQFMQAQGEFMEAMPSDQAKGKCAPVQQEKVRSLKLWFLVFAATTIIKVTLFVTQLIPSLKENDTIAYFSLFNLAESWFYFTMLRKHKMGFDFQKWESENELLKQSSSLAISLPRILVSECGHCKFLKQQVSYSSYIHHLAAALAALQLFLVSVPLSAGQKSALKMVDVSPYLSDQASALLFYGISIVPGFFIFFLMVYTIHRVQLARKVARNSVACNLRGFTVANNYGLDYSEAHALDEGLCYMFGNVPMLYIPYISVKDAFIHLEPYKTKITFKFTTQQLLALDARHNDRARDVLKRGYDQLVYDDVLVYVVFHLQNEVRIWIPLSPTQLQEDDYAETSFFGYMGQEIATILQLISSQIVDDEAESQKSKLIEIAQFCQDYQNKRQLSVAEEGLHITQFEKLFVPIVEE